MCTIHLSSLSKWMPSFQTEGTVEMVSLPIMMDTSPTLLSCDLVLNTMSSVLLSLNFNKLVLIQRHMSDIHATRDCKHLSFPPG